MFEEMETPEIVEKVSSCIWILDETKHGRYKKCYSIAMKLNIQYTCSEFAHLHLFMISEKNLLVDM